MRPTRGPRSGSKKAGMGFLEPGGPGEKRTKPWAKICRPRHMLPSRSVLRQEPDQNLGRSISPPVARPLSSMEAELS